MNSLPNNFYISLLVCGWFLKINFDPLGHVSLFMYFLIFSPSFMHLNK